MIRGIELRNVFPPFRSRRHPSSVRLSITAFCVRASLAKVWSSVLAGRNGGTERSVTRSVDLEEDEDDGDSTLGVFFASSINSFGRMNLHENILRGPPVCLPHHCLSPRLLFINGEMIAKRRVERCKCLSSPSSLSSGKGGADGMDSDAPFAATNQLRWVATTTGVRSNDTSLSCAQSVYSISLPSLLS